MVSPAGYIEIVICDPCLLKEPHQACLAWSAVPNDVQGL